MSMAIHDEIFYEMAKKESITLTDDEKAALKNSEKDFWYDLSDIDGAKKLGVEKKDIYSSMEKSAIARKYQEIYAGLPTGCESVSAAMVLQYLGFSVTIVVIFGYPAHFNTLV